MNNKTVIVAVGALLVLMCSGAVVTIAAGGGIWYTLQGSSQDTFCQVSREAARDRWLMTLTSLEEDQAREAQRLEEHRAGRERAALVRDIEATDRYDGLISSSDNRITSLGIAIDAADEMQTSLLTLPAGDIIQQASILQGMPWDEEIEAQISDALGATFAIQDVCTL